MPRFVLNRPDLHLCVDTSYRRFPVAAVFNHHLTGSGSVAPRRGVSVANRSPVAFAALRDPFAPLGTTTATGGGAGTGAIVVSASDRAWTRRSASSHADSADFWAFSA